MNEVKVTRPRLLILSHEVVDTKMAGPGMRYFELACALADDLDVTLAIPAETSLHVDTLHLVRYSEEQPHSVQGLVDKSDIALIPGYLFAKFPFLMHTRARLVADLYDPMVLENLYYYIHEPDWAQQSFNQQAIAVANLSIQLGDFFICGSERQRDFWMGMLMANGRVNPRTFAQDPSLRLLIDVVGIGFPNREPEPHPILRGRHPAFTEDTQIVLWGGGIWDWLDPLTLVKSWRHVVAKCPKARLVFLGTRHPNPLVPPHRMADQVQALSSEIGEKDHTIFFFEWMPFAEREALLCEADIGVTLHPLHVETRYSIRTRVLDYFWARLPVLISDGDVTSEWVRQFKVGQVVPPLDEAAVTDALLKMLNKPKSEWASAFTPLPATFAWTRVSESLKRYCLSGGYAPDRIKRNADGIESNVSSAAYVRLARARYIWRTEGAHALLRRIGRFLQWQRKLR